MERRTCTRHFCNGSGTTGPRNGPIISAISMVGAISGGIVIGLISDRIGRRKAIVISLLLGMLVIPLWALCAARRAVDRGRIPAAVLRAGGLGRDPRAS